MTNQRQAQMGQTFFALNTPDNAPEYHNFDTARQRNKAPRSQKNIDHRWQPYPIRAYPPDFYNNQNFVPPGPYDNMIPPQVQAAASFDAPVMQAQLPALPEGVKHWPVLHSLKDLRAPIMRQYPPAPSVVQSQIQATSYDQCYNQGLVHQASSECATEGSSVQRTKRKAVDSDGTVRKKQQKNPRIRPDNDPEFQQVVKDGEVMYVCLKEQCAEIYLKESSVHEHKQTNRHQKRSNHLPCLGCGHYYSRSDGLKRHAKSKQCSKNQENPCVAPTNLVAGTFMIPLQVNVPQGPSTFQGTGPAVQAPGLNSMTHKVTPFAQNILSLPDVGFSIQAPHEQRTTPHQPSGVPLVPITDQEGGGDMDLLGPPVSLALPGRGYSALVSVVPAPSTFQFDASESYWDWYKRLEQPPVHGDLV